MLTERIAARSQLRHALVALGTLLAGVAVALLAPLSLMMGNAHCARER
jgi:hypothetical protein